MSMLRVKIHNMGWTCGIRTRQMVTEGVYYFTDHQSSQDLQLISVVVGFIRPFLGYSNIAGLFIGKDGEFNTNMLKM